MMNDEQEGLYSEFWIQPWSFRVPHFEDSSFKLKADG
jgi:hypothetical protein